MIDGAHVVVYSKDAEADGGGVMGLYEPKHAGPKR